MISTASDTAQNARDYARIEAAILYLEEHFRDQPSLDDVAREAGLSPHHFQRLFRRWAGVSPKRFGQFLTLDYAKAQLEASASILDAAYDAGLSGPSRLHDLFVTYEAMSPGAFKQGGDGVDIAYGVHPSPFGPCFVGQTERGVCALGFADDDGSDAHAVRAEFERRWPAARFHEDQATTEAIVARIFDYGPATSAKPLRLAVCGTNFQLKVWEALLRIPSGRITSYDALGRALGLSRSARAVGGAVAANPISYLIPCHRVIRRSGRISNYEWGQSRKRVMLGWEAARFGSEDPGAAQGQTALA
ncbi:MAG: methylated-DNA--[protein]-cysteine S-methyltransferase [Rhodospirillales bacterium]|nr:methylated-DNA--[protein]-cysteine S-methyltransferase [Rhodospirillales bacterium]